MEVAQLLLSLLHAWGMDPDLDRVCEGKLGLLRPMVPVSFGVLSKGGVFSCKRIICILKKNQLFQLIIFKLIKRCLQNNIF